MTPVPATRVSEGRVTAIPHPAYPATTVFVPAGDVADALEIMNGRFDFKKTPRDPHVRTLLDLAPHNGAFAAWAYTRFPYAWIDIFEPDEDRRRLCVLNAPPGTRIHEENILEELRELAAARSTDDLKSRYDLVVDAVHVEALSKNLVHMSALPIDWGHVQLAIVEHDPSAFGFVAGFFKPFCHLVAADRGFTAWVRS